ncbi:hypothetical protein F5884DRAFT_23484 [Xylogone sp. PMI_703]|nr:hypothetical protein F5884DRAFT_23484 [Xylogone sp. PMI_703]
MTTHDEAKATPTSSSGTSTPPQSRASSFHIPTTVSHAVSGLLRRFSSDPQGNLQKPATASRHGGLSEAKSDVTDEVYTPHRTASPFQPPPLYPLILKGYRESTAQSAQLLSKSLAEEIRLLVPPRLQLCEEWNLVYSLDQDGVSLGTLYKKCDALRGLRNGYVLVVKDGDGGLFGAYLTDAPHPSPHYFGTGECFLWRAAILSANNFGHLPPPPSADTTNLQRSTTVSAVSTSNGNLAPPSIAPGPGTGASTPERIRFKAFPYSGINDYMMLCDPTFLSVGGGDGHYGLWLDDSFEKGISSTCLTFGNEPLSDEGEKFDILGVEIWTIGNMP